MVPSPRGGFGKLDCPSAGQSLLDFPCGTGLVTMRAVRAVGKAAIVVGVDNSEGILKEAQLREEDLEGGEEVVQVVSGSKPIQITRVTFQLWRGWRRKTALTLSPSAVQ